MPEVFINDEAVEIEAGERLLDAARRHASHIGFVCDGNGLCQMCECTVLKGDDLLNPPTESEYAWLTQWQLENQRRLACQASPRKEGTIEVLTRAEDLRRQTIAAFNPPEGADRQENLNRLFNSVMTVNLEHLKRFPVNVYYASIGVFALRPTFESARQMLDDCRRIALRLMRS